MLRLRYVFVAFLASGGPELGVSTYLVTSRLIVLQMAFSSELMNRGCTAMAWEHPQLGVQARHIKS